MLAQQKGNPYLPYKHQQYQRHKQGAVHWARQKRKEKQHVNAVVTQYAVTGKGKMQVGRFTVQAGE